MSKIQLSKNALTVLEKRYLLKDENRKLIETPEDLFRRVTNSIGNNDEEKEKFYDLMTSLRFLPNSPTLMNAGTDLGQLSACFVLPVEDDMSGIFETVKSAALIHQSGGGCCAAGTIIPTIEYGLVPIEKIPEFSKIPSDEKGHSCKPFTVFSFDETTESFTRAEVSHLWRFNKDSYLRIDFGTEGFVKVTDWHPFIVYEPFPNMQSGGEYKTKRADELNKDDWLVTPSFHDNLFINEEPDFWWLYGFFLGDGSLDTTKNGVRVRFHSKDSHYLDRISTIVSSYTGGVKGSIFTDKRNGCKTLSIVSSYNKREQYDDFSAMFNRKLADFVKRFVELNQNNQKKKVSPNQTFMCPNPRAVISGLIDSDGWIGKDFSGIATGNKELKDFIVRHLSLLGINCKVRYRVDERKRKIKGSWWSIEFSTGYTQLLFTEKNPRKTRLLASRKIKVKKISKVQEQMQFFDFTVPRYHNYLGGNTQFVSIHNTGFSFSRLRPKGDVVKTTGGVASGPISFMEVFNAATNTVKQGGKRRGANMGILRIDHPDIMEFITCKEDQSRFTNFNISVAVTESFMKAVEKEEDYDLINPRTKKIIGKLNAKEVFNKIVELSWKNGEPGMVFIDRINKSNPTPELGEIESTNPCGEQPLLPYESCNLGSINLSRHVTDGSIDWALLEETVRSAVLFLDNVIDKNRYVLPEIEEMTKGNRKIGLGVMGFADLLVKLIIVYDSKESLTLAEEIMSFIQKIGLDESIKLGKEKGSFPNFKHSIFKEKYEAMRNATITTIAPTGTISLIAGNSSGIEPYYAVAYTRNILGGEKLFDVNPLFESIAKERGFYSQELIEEIASSNSIKEMDEIPEDVRKIFTTSHDLTPEWHIKLQAAFQKHVDNATSKTINFPSSATKEDIAKAYILAYKNDCKGITVYRDGSRKYQVLSTKKKETEEKPSLEKLVTEENGRIRGRVEPRDRPNTTLGKTHKVRSGCGNLYVTVNRDEYGVCEVFVSVGKSGGCIASQSEAVGRLISLSLRSGVKLNSVARQLVGIRCPNPSFYEGNTILSCSDGIAHVLEKYTDGNKIIRPNGTIACPECGGMLEFSEGCYICRVCGYSKCD